MPETEAVKIKNSKKSDQMETPSTSGLIPPMVKFSSNEAIEGFRESAGTIEIVGYVDAVERPKIVGQQMKWKVMKFVLNNDKGKRIQCVAWEENATRIVDIIKLNSIIHLDRAELKPIKVPRYNIGNVENELKIVEDTIITIKGEYKLEKTYNLEIHDATWDNVANMEDKKIRWIKTAFRQSRHKSGMASYGLGAITDGSKMLDVNMISYSSADDKWPKGIAVQVIGVVKSSKWPYLVVETPSDISLTDEAPINPENLFDIVSTPQKKPKLE